MAKGGGSLGRGRKTREETAPLPDRSQLNDLEGRAQTALKGLVDDAGGRWGLIDAKSIPVGHLDLVVDLLARWMVQYSTPHKQSGRAYFPGRPGLWHALDDLVPLQDPNRWNPLRAAATAELSERGFERIGGVNGATWFLPTIS